ncbi:mitochondrial carrier domain-containing protein [Powellomyces hirtus]|nr:mitochondrial carrier domain-containing protein [Powellomyces hirtus]
MYNTQPTVPNFQFRKEENVEEPPGTVESKFRTPNGDHLKSIVSGAVAGAATVVAGHPFDTVKVLLQTKPSRNLTMSAWFREIVKKRGISGLYRGMSSPLLAVTPRYALRFWAYDLGCHLFAPTSHPREDGGVTVTTSIMAGAFAAIPTTIVTAPTEYLKVKLQTQDGHVVPPQGHSRSDTKAGAAGSGAPGIVDATRDAVHQGGVRGLFRGTFATLARDVPGFAAYFVAYEAVHTVAIRGVEPGMYGWEVLGTVGLGVGGLWMMAIPPDVIKSRIQASPPGTYNGFTDAARRMIKTEGISSLFRGTGPALLRLIPANAAGFVGRVGSLAIMNQLW